MVSSITELTTLDIIKKISRSTLFNPSLLIKIYLDDLGVRTGEVGGLVPGLLCHE